MSEEPIDLLHILGSISDRYEWAVPARDNLAILMEAATAAVEALYFADAHLHADRLKAALSLCGRGK